MSEKRSHEPKGTYVSVIREEHGWHDGAISGFLVDNHGTVEIDSDPNGKYTVECRHRRDYTVIQAPSPSRETKNGQKRRSQGPT